MKCDEAGQRKVREHAPDWLPQEREKRHVPLLIRVLGNWTPRVLGPKDTAIRSNFRCLEAIINP